MISAEQLCGKLSKGSVCLFRVKEKFYYLQAVEIDQENFIRIEEEIITHGNPKYFSYEDDEEEHKS